MTIGPQTSLDELAFIVCTALDRAGQTAVLAGGAAAQLYTPNDYSSSDLDFVLSLQSSDSESSATLEHLGYERRGRSLFHPNNPFTVEFSPGPLVVGEEEIHSWDTIRRGEMLLHVITPTDSVRDRLAAFLHWNDRGSLEVAAAVERAQREKIDLSAIENWCRKEGGYDKFLEFERKLNSKS